MSVKYKVPSQAASGSDTFNDAIVGLQITNGSNQLTNANFNIDRTIPEKDSKIFRSDPFSDFITLDDLNQVIYSGISTSYSTTTSPDNVVKFKKSKNNGNVSLFGSLKEKIKITIVDIIKKYPAGVYVDVDTDKRSSDYSAQDIVYDEYTNTTDFFVPTSMFFNPLDVVFNSLGDKNTSNDFNDMRNFYSSYSKYVIEFSGKTFDILYYYNSSNGFIKLRTIGNIFDGSSTYSNNFLIRPNNGFVEEFYNSLNDLETILLNRFSTPKFTATFNIVNDSNGIETRNASWPLLYDNWNIQTSGFHYNIYLNKLLGISNIIDDYTSNLIIRFLVSPQLFEFDTEDKKIESIFQIYGQSFDEIKKYIDNIKNMRNITYDGVENVPNLFLKNLTETLGLNVSNLYNEKTFNETSYERNSSNYGGLSIGLNLKETEYEIYRRLLNNLSYLYKSKGTRKSIEFLLKFIGAPDPMIVVDEYIYRTNGVLPTSNLERDILDVISSVKKTNTAVYNTITKKYDVTPIIGSTSLYRNEYPVDETTGLPRKLETEDGLYYFEKGAGWYKKTLQHRSKEILDENNSNLTSRIKTIKTMSKPFTYGEDYFDIFRKLPGLNYGYNLVSEVDNKKTQNVTSVYDEKTILNRKNLNIFLSPSKVINYSIYRNLKDLNLNNNMLMLNNNGILTNDGASISYLNNDDNIDDDFINTMTFENFINDFLNIFIKNSNIVKYEKKYNSLTQLFYDYLYSIEKPYDYVTLLEYINKLSPNWLELIEQFVPATTLWCGGVLIENNITNRSKYQHKKNTKNESFNFSMIDYYGTEIIGVI